MLPRINYDANNDIRSITIWHPFNGIWTLITQSFQDNDQILYYTDGELVQTETKRKENLIEFRVG